MFCAFILANFGPISSENILYFFLLLNHFTSVFTSTLTNLEHILEKEKAISLKEKYIFCSIQQRRSWVSWEGLTKEIFCCPSWYSQILHKLTLSLKSLNMYRHHFFYRTKKSFCTSGPINGSYSDSVLLYNICILYPVRQSCFEILSISTNLCIMYI